MRPIDLWVVSSQPWKAEDDVYTQLRQVEAQPTENISFSSKDSLLKSIIR